MKIDNSKGYTVITADNGMFLTNENGLYGTEIILGDSDSPENYTELPLSEYPQELVPDEPQENDRPFLLEYKKAQKIADITEYDLSSNVNSFTLNGYSMWLDRETRAVLRNTIESLEIVGRDTLNIWYGNNNIELDLNSARQLLAVLEVYATDCYNVTAQHKVVVSQMTTIDDIEEFDITAGYPPMPHFGDSQNGSDNGID